MKLTQRSIRNLIHKKQEKSSVKSGVPRLADMKEGTPELRYTQEGLCWYAKYRNVLYKRVFVKHNEDEFVTIET